MPTLPLTCAILELIFKHQPDTVRGNMYVVVSAGLLPDTTKESYGKVQLQLLKLRRRGVVPYSWVVDNIRETTVPTMFADLDEFAADVHDWYRKDYWPHFPEHVEVIVEKDTIAGKLARVTKKHGVPLHAMRGYNSESFAWEIAQGWGGINRPIIIYYFGDHDPSGRDMERDIKERLAGFSGKQFRWVRLAVTENDMVDPDLNIIPIAIKRKDRRTPKFIEQYGEACAEVEAIPAELLRARLTGAIKSHIPAGAWERMSAMERNERARWGWIMAQAGIGDEASKDSGVEE
jgi:hypothetical protein